MKYFASTKFKRKKKKKQYHIQYRLDKKYFIIP